jgi:glucose-6-phosphate 1-epimerase
MHQPDGDSMNFTFRFSITSYRGGWESADVPCRCEDWLDPYARWIREHNVPRVARKTVAEPPPTWTGLIEKPRAGHGEKDGQMYLLWGAEMSPGFSHYELYRDGKFLANVTNEVHEGIPYRVARYEDLGLPTHSRHEYRIRKVWEDGKMETMSEPFCGLTRYVSEEERSGVVCEGEYGRLSVRFDGATVTSWKPEVLKGGEVFFMPATAPWGEEVHGGVPICWPWFAAREGAPKHGLARYLKWRLVRRIGKDGVELETTSTPETMKVWPHPFKLTARISIDGPDALTIVVTEKNTGKDTFVSAFGVHPYLSVADACQTDLDGERLPTPWVLKEFAADGKTHRLEDPVGKRTCTISSSSNDDWFAWNPGVARTPLCETLAPDEWRRFWCLEPFMREAKPMAPGESRTHRVRLTVAALP